MFELILNSSSPRRKKLLQEAGYDFAVDPVKVSEIIDENLKMTEAIQGVARQKSVAYVDSGKLPESGSFLVLSGDTMVVYKDQALGKPKTKDQAFDFLRQLTGNEHSVITAVCLYDSVKSVHHSFYSETKVWFHELSDQKIWDYIDTGEPMDKAGAYGIQGQGGKLVARTSGSWSNVVGLPMEDLDRFIERHGWNLRKTSIAE